MISIIIPIYNSAVFLEDCFNSVRSQSYLNFEVICINDGSKDSSEDICKKYVDMDCRFRYFMQNNGGVSKARNFALKHAKGEYICFVDSDDVIDKDYLRTLLNLSKECCLAICGYTRKQDELGGVETNRITYNSIQLIHHIIDESIKHPNIPTMLFVNSIIQDHLIRFTEGCVRNEDTEFYMKYFTYVGSVVISDYKGYFYRDNLDSAVHRFDKKALTFIEADERISAFLRQKKVVDEDNLIVASSIQYFLFHTARQRNLEIYEYIHVKYDVKKEMKRMLLFPKISRAGVALVYLTLGKHLFFYLLCKLVKE